MKIGHNARRFLLASALLFPFAHAFGQATPPFVTVTDFVSDSTTAPLVLVTGGAQSSTQGVEVSGQSTSTLGTAPTFPYITSPGLGGLSLVQLGKMTSDSSGVNSPFFSLCAQQVVGMPTATSTPECWAFQVLGGGNPNTQDILQLRRTSTQHNVTLEVPNALNIAAGDAALMQPGQLTISSVPTNAADLTTYPITVVGAFTNDVGGIAGPLQLFPGFLNSTSTLQSDSVEGPLQIGMAVKGSGTSYELACYISSQIASPCGNTTSPLLGVYLTSFACNPQGQCSTGNSSAVITPPGRAIVASAPGMGGSGTYWGPGMPICRDPSHPADGLLAPSGVACPIGQAVGVAVGDAIGSTPTMHAVDLDFSDQGVATSRSTTTYVTGTSSFATAPAGVLLTSDGFGNVNNSGASGAFTSTPYVPQVIGVTDINSQSASVVPTTIVSAPATGVYNIGGALYSWSVGVGCSGTPASVKVTISWMQDDSTSASESFTSVPLPLQNTSISSVQVSVNQMISAKTGTNIQYSTTFSPGTCTTTQPTYALRLRATRE